MSKEFLECDTGNCEAPKGSRSITNCIHCGGELIEENGIWYHWSSFNNGVLMQGAQPQDYVTLSNKK
jgi:hypothetical protein